MSNPAFAEPGARPAGSLFGNSLRSKQRRIADRRAVAYRSQLHPNRTVMSTLSRREEDTLLKTTKAHALKECDSIVKGALTCWKRGVLPLTVHRDRFCRMCHWSHCHRGLGLQKQVQGCPRLYVSIVSTFQYLCHSPGGHQNLTFTPYAVHVKTACK